ncbi:unnamed protein product [Rotaria magnacalcarata]|uniref:F-box domain-containing protein n=1 Tax=Rotaria magnacalcarata TaxID=392030 RepID=A0A816T781_9BILA|nr:unnamed protein product [Rotaria magnacalcarata]CAF1407495.1 unnamed protein product [Rotaria magnacalcarata]CAF2093427.1 unnamed protein product [Rotaria magnacalcarata]CAF3862062.1 unnamed protein product [Rotaria magnacalcarata]
MNDYRQRLGLSRRIEPSTASMGKFFSNRLHDSLHFSGTLTAHEGENFDETSADYEATPEPPISLYDANRPVVTPSSTSSMNESYFTHTTPDIHKFSRRVELSSGYNILKNRSSSRPTRLPAYLQGRTPLAQLNPLPTSLTTSNSDDNRQRRLSFTDHNRMQNLAYSQQILQQYNVDGTRRPFSSDSPLPPPLQLPAPAAAAALNSYYTSSAPSVHNRTTYEPIEPLKLVSTQEDNSIAALSRELRAAAYPTTRKSANHSPTRETSPSTTRYSTRTNSKRVPPRSLPKLHVNEQQTPISNVKLTSFYHHHEPEKNLSITEDRLQSSSTASLLLDQFFNTEQTPTKETTTSAHEVISMSSEKSHREHSQVNSILMRHSSLPNGTDDTTMSFVSKYARLAPIVSYQTLPSNRNSSANPIDEHSTNMSRSFMLETNHHEQMFDTLHDLSSFHNESSITTDDLLQTSEMIYTDCTINESDENYSYVPLKEQMKSMNEIPLLELDELETSSDISESQLVPIIYAKELENEIGLLQKAHLLKQQQRSNAMNNENDRMNDNSSIPPPANMELLNFEALEEEFTTSHQPRHDDNTPLPSPKVPSPKLPSPTVPSIMMEVSSSPIPTKSVSPPPLSELETPITNALQQSILAYNRLSPWFKLPTELWFKILPYLNTKELNSFSRVCKRFYLLVQDQACRHQIMLYRRKRLEQIWFDAIGQRKPIALSFIECRQEILENLQHKIENDPDNIKWFEFFQKIGSTLIDFTMTGCYHEPFTPNTLLPIIVQTCSSLLSLNFRWNNITESTLNHLIAYPQFTHLHTLDLSGCQTLDDTLLINMFIRTETDFHLKKLVLHACTNITWISLDTIAICIPNLLHLNVSRCIGLKNLSSNLESTCFHYWPQLEYVDFDNLLTLTDNDLTIVFDNCKYLNTLICDDCINLTDQTLNRLTSDFRMISLNNCTTLSTNVFLNLNEQCPKLETISLNSINNFNDDCLLKWSEKPLVQLKFLSINNCTDCTVNGIENFLERHFNLQELSLNGNILSSQIERQTLEQKFPNINFVFQ